MIGPSPRGLERLAELLRARHVIDRDIAALVGRPAQIGHLGEFIASRIFDLALNASASARGYDGTFASGPLAGRRVDVKWTSKNDGLLNLDPAGLTDYYLVLAGPRTPPGSSRGAVRPWVIEAVFLFAGAPLLEALRARGVKIGIATSVGVRLWEAAEIYPIQRNPALPVSAEQRRLLALFSGRG